MSYGVSIKWHKCASLPGISFPSSPRVSTTARGEPPGQYLRREAVRTISSLWNESAGLCRWVGTGAILDVLVHGIAYQAVWISESFYGWSERQFRFEHRGRVSSLSAFISWSACIALCLTLLPAVRRRAYWVRFHIIPCLRTCASQQPAPIGISELCSLLEQVSLLFSTLCSSTDSPDCAGVLLVTHSGISDICRFWNHTLPESLEVLHTWSGAIWHRRGLPVATGVPRSDRLHHSWHFNLLHRHSSGGKASTPMTEAS